MCAKFNIDILYFIEGTKQSSTICKNAENPQIFSQLSAALTLIQLKTFWIGPYHILWLLLDTFSLQNSLLYSLVIDLIPFLSYSFLKFM